MKIKLLPILFAVLLCFTSCKDQKDKESITCDRPQNALLTLTEDLGEEYLDSFIFFGESTTYHMKDRGVLRDGTNTKQVWGPRSGTVNLDLSTKDIKIVYPENGKEITVAEAASISRPRHLVLTFGLNGAVQKIKHGKELFKYSYKALIESIQKASPETRIILQSAFPVATNMDMTNYTVDANTLNQYIDTLNEWTFELANDLGLKYLNTAEILKDKSGALIFEYQCGDGHHLSTEAYKKILGYIRTHGYR